MLWVRHTVKLTAFHLFLHARQYPRVIEEQKATNNRRKIKEKIIYKNEYSSLWNKPQIRPRKAIAKFRNYNLKSMISSDF